MSTITNCTSASRPGAPAAGDLAFETDTKRMICWDSSAWQTYESDRGPYGLDASNILSVSPVVHYDAGLINGLNASANPSNAASLTGTWTAKWPHNHVLQAQGTAGAQPTFYTSGQNSKPYLSFDGGDFLFFETPLAVGASCPFNFWIVAEKTGAGFAPWGSKANLNPHLWFSHSNDDDYYYHSHGLTPEPVGFPKDPQIWSLARDTSNVTKAYHNGDNTGPSGTFGSRDYPILVNAFGKGEATGFTTYAKIYEFIIFVGTAAYPATGQLSAADLNKLNAYAHAKYVLPTAPTNY